MVFLFSKKICLISCLLALLLMQVISKIKFLIKMVLNGSIYVREQLLGMVFKCRRSFCVSRVLDFNEFQNQFLKIEYPIYPLMKIYPLQKSTILKIKLFSDLFENLQSCKEYFGSCNILIDAKQ